MPIYMLLSREIRRVPLDYECPTDHRGGKQARYDEFYVPAVKDWLERRERWVSGEGPDANEHPECTFEEWDGNGPDPDYYYPGDSWPADAEMGIQMYETVSEGSPISAVYPDTDAGRAAMADELAVGDHGITTGMSSDDWMRIIEGQVLAQDIHTGEIVG